MKMKIYNIVLNYYKKYKNHKYTSLPTIERLSKMAEKATDEKSMNTAINMHLYWIKHELEESAERNKSEIEYHYINYKNLCVKDNKIVLNKIIGQLESNGYKARIIHRGFNPLTSEIY